MVLKQRPSPTSTRAPLMAGALAIAAVALTPAAIAAPPDGPLSAEAIVSLVVLGILCTAAAFVLFGVLIAEVGARRGRR